MQEFDSPGAITVLLKAWAAGEEQAREELIALIYDELRHLARRSRRNSGSSETLRTTALVHEAYLRLAGIKAIDWQDRHHFYALSAQVMRRILVDAVRAREASKRGGGIERLYGIDFDEIASLNKEHERDMILALDEALTRLSEQDPRRAQIVELRVFAGLSVDETATIIGTSPETVMRDFRISKAWLLRELSPGAHS